MKRNAAWLYERRMDKARRLIQEIEGALAQHERRQQADPDNWGHVGDLEPVTENLELVLYNLTGRESAPDDAVIVSGRECDAAGVPLGDEE